MLHRRYIIGMMLAGTLMLTSCTEEEAGMNPGSLDAVPIAFECTATEIPDSGPPGATRTANGYTGNITTTNNNLRYTGFGMFAAHASGVKPDLMFNQQVEYVFPASGAGAGYWTYSPLKYWPADPVGTCFYAYAPYVDEPSGLASGTTGIIGMSNNNSTSAPYIIYARARHPEENVDLLWYYKQVAADDALLTDGRPNTGKAIPVRLQHALARVKVSLGVTNATTLDAGDKLLVRRVTFTGSIAQEGKLNLASTGTTPTWYDQYTQSTTIFIDCTPEANPDSYGIITEEARYIRDLPYSWQPSGLPHTNYDAGNAATKTNLLCMGDAPSYLYLIPQSSLTLSCVLDYCIIAADGTVTEDSRPQDNPYSFNITPLNGNTTYDLTLKITI